MEFSAIIYRTFVASAYNATLPLRIRAGFLCAISMCACVCVVEYLRKIRLGFINKKKIAMRMHGTTETLLSFGPPVADKNDFPIFLFCFPFPPSITVRQSHLHINLCARIAIKIEKKKMKRKENALPRVPIKIPYANSFTHRESWLAHTMHTTLTTSKVLCHIVKKCKSLIFICLVHFFLSHFIFFF